MNILEHALVKRAGSYRIKWRLVLASDQTIEAFFYLPGAPPWRRIVENPEKHCLMRALDKLFVQGNPTIGRIGTQLLYDPLRGGCKCMTSFAVTDCKHGEGILKGHRLVLFPSWWKDSCTIAFCDSSGVPRLFDAHHVTFEPNKDGTVNCHATHLNGEKRCLNRRMRPEGDHIQICQTLVQDHRRLDPVGVIKRSIPCPSDSRSTIQRWRESLRTNFPERHILMTPPQVASATDDDVILVKTYISNTRSEPPRNDRFPGIVFSTLPSKAIVGPVRKRSFFARLSSNLYLSSATMRLDGTLLSKVIWTFDK